jgi:hypothetical protein
MKSHSGEGKVKRADRDFLQDLVVVGTSEGRVATEQDVHVDPCAPDVTLLVVPALEDLGGDVVRGAELRRHRGAWSVRTARCRSQSLSSKRPPQWCPARSSQVSGPGGRCCARGRRKPQREFVSCSSRPSPQKTTRG